jgi:hypothetical protein
MIELKLKTRFSKLVDPFWAYGCALVITIVLTAFGKTHPWAAYAGASFFAIIPLAFIIASSFAYGKWLSAELHAYRADHNSWIAKWYLRLRRALSAAICLVFALLITGLVVIIDPDPDLDPLRRALLWLLSALDVWIALQILLRLVLVFLILSIISFSAYTIYNAQKTRRLRLSASGQDRICANR